MQYVKNVNGGPVMMITDYIDLLIRETVDAWNDLDDEEQEDYGNSFIKFYESHNEIDSDFTMSDQEGNVLADEEQGWNDFTLKYQSDQLIKQVNGNGEK